MRVERTQYSVAGWGSGMLWTSAEGVVLAHEFVLGRADALTADANASLPSSRAGRSPDAGGPSAAPVGSGAAAALPAAPLEGAASPPGATLPGGGARVGRAIVPRRTRADAPALSPAIGGRESRNGSELVARLAAFFAGSEDTLADVPIDLGWCTPFQRAVTGSLRAVPRGEVVSYGELAALAGHPNAQRAVGTFCARNRFMLLVPCHRVVAADGIGRYGSAGVAVKQRLLALEGVDL
ncbi:MAG TPA: methylated-DNA--[protein]-cysteine S-methyltransferase [Gaiellaceae bacterium]|nr:methylated-DNA--[protein]-cysteine S-methyltransferase [Gaiellaceae bacterium]